MISSSLRIQKQDSFDFEMNSTDWIEPDEFLRFIQQGGEWLDVRAPVEFVAGHIPRSMNIGILSDSERTEVGTTYKQKGQSAAITLGHQLVSGEVKAARIEAWIKTLLSHPRMAITCARGGMRSGLTQEWLKAAGVSRPRARGGIKALRAFYTETFERLIAHPHCTVGGPTGAGKTKLLADFRALEEGGLVPAATVDLENFAHHRGSAFGPTHLPQPAQATFENRVAHRMIELEAAQLTSQISSPWFVESESRMIGRMVLMPELHHTIVVSPMILVTEDFESRVANTFDEYICQTALTGDNLTQALEVFASYRNSLQRITNKLGSQRMGEILKLINLCESEYLQSRKLEGNRDWIRLLLKQYYDPMYEHGLKSRDGKTIFEGSRHEALEFMRSLSSR